MFGYPYYIYYGLKVQLQKLSHQRNINLIKEFKSKVVHMLVTLLNWCAYMQDYDDGVIEKHIINTKVIPYENKTIIKPERKGEGTHPWDIAQEIMAEQRQAALAVKWAILPLETLMDEQFLLILHAIEEITDVTPLREAASQLPKKIYKIVRQHEQLTEIPAELTDQLISVTMSEIRSQIHRLENTIEGNFEHISEPDSPSWVFPGDIVELHAPEDDIIFHGEGDSETPPNRQQ